MGDFNLSFIGWTRNSISGPCSAVNYGSPVGLALTYFMSLNNLTQMNNKYNIDGKILDLVLTNCFTLQVTDSLDA